MTRRRKSSSKVNKFRYNVNRRKLWKKAKKVPTIESEPIKNAWVAHKGIPANFASMGLSADVNKTLRIPKTKELLRPAAVDADKSSRQKPLKGYVADELAAEAALKPERKWSLSDPVRKFCIYMIEKYGDDYKAMARDPRNYYQKTPKQIKGTILTFKRLPETYNAYLETKKQKEEASQEQQN
ncbi:Nucleolar protein 16 [Holothuria leucospilota]|uniref:Nucleolar protein 16 n=1 Tax=Holothuria leucospilota TaxID=206669 RepID=A0A9Q1BHN7_HOLLE|nr:Nucleolar protein 16 [Holothuria leucospilota]